MEKTSKKKHYFTLEKELNDIFEKHISDNTINKPKLIEKLIIQYLEKNK